MVTEHGDGSLDIDGRLPIEAFAARVGEVLTQGERDADIDTIGGLVFTLAGRVPGRGEAIGYPIRCGVPHPGSRCPPHPAPEGAPCPGPVAAGGEANHQPAPMPQRCPAPVECFDAAPWIVATD